MGYLNERTIEGRRQKARFILLLLIHFSWHVRGWSIAHGWVHYISLSLSCVLCIASLPHVPVVVA